MRTTFLWVTFRASSSSRLKRRSRSRAAAGILERLGANHLDRDDDGELFVPGLEHRAHPTLTQRANEVVPPAESHAGLEGVVGNPALTCRRPAAVERGGLFRRLARWSRRPSGSTGAAGVAGAGAGEPSPERRSPRHQPAEGSASRPSRRRRRPGTALPHVPQKRCEASTGPPQCGQIISGFLPTPFGHEVSHYGANLEPGTMCWSGL